MSRDADEPANLTPAEAERLSRLRIMLADARSRASDRSALGKHLAVVGADGVGELGIGICAHKRGVLRPGKPLLATLLQLLTDISAKAAPGEQGFRELHAARNQAQHQGILPDPEQLPRWLDETEALITFLVEQCFGIDLSTVGSASAVHDERIAAVLREAEEAVEDERVKSAVESSWKAIQAALILFKRHTGLGRSSMLEPLGQRISAFQAIKEEMASLARQNELSLFASEPGEWMWFKQCHEDTQRGLDPTVGEARRAFVFALSWVLRMESYVSRHGPERWERWHQRRAPKTGLPGGPHIQDVFQGRTLASRNEIEWIFQLTDLPDNDNPDFCWAIGAAREQTDDPIISHAYLNPTGELGIRSSHDATPTQLAASVRGLITRAHRVMQERTESDLKETSRRNDLRESFVAAIDSVGLPLKEAIVRPADRGQGPLVVYLELADVGVDGRSWFSKYLKDRFDDHMGEHNIHECDLRFAGVVVPATWPPWDVAEWLADARGCAHLKDSAEREQDQKRRDEREQFLSDLKDQVLQGSISGTTN